MASPSSPYYVPPDFGGNSGPYRDRFLPSTGQTGNVLSVTWDFRPVIRLISRMSGEFYRADGAVRAAHLEMAQWVQHYQAEHLISSIKQTGREQKSTQALVGAVLDERSSSVSSTGFTSGYLNRIQEVELYWRRIEEGSATQVGQTFLGAFLSAKGKWSAPTSEGPHTDLRLIKFNKAINDLATKSYLQRALEGTAQTTHTTVTIGKPIPAYHFLADGFQEFLAKEGRFPSIIGFYTQAFKEARMDFAERWARRYGAARPSPASVTKGYGSPG